RLKSASSNSLKTLRPISSSSLALEELEIGLNVFNELDDADFSRYSSPTGEKYRSSSSETGRPAATPLRRGSDPQIRIIATAAANIAAATIPTTVLPIVELGWPCISLSSEATTRMA